MKTIVLLRVRGNLTEKEVNAPNPSNGAAIALLSLPPYIDRLHDVQIISSIGYCGFRSKVVPGKAAPTHPVK